VLDSTGKAPDGILADVTYFCDYMDAFFYPDYCNIRNTIIKNDFLEKQFEQDFVIPRGNTIAFGSFEGRFLFFFQWMNVHVWAMKQFSILSIDKNVLKVLI